MFWFLLELPGSKAEGGRETRNLINGGGADKSLRLTHHLSLSLKDRGGTMAEPGLPYSLQSRILAP